MNLLWRGGVLTDEVVEDVEEGEADSLVVATLAVSFSFFSFLSFFPFLLIVFLQLLTFLPSMSLLLPRIVFCTPSASKFFLLLLWFGW